MIFVRSVEERNETQTAVARLESQLAKQHREQQLAVTRVLFMRFPTLLTLAALSVSLGCQHIRLVRIRSGTRAKHPLVSGTNI
jgi:hypothetical protein